MTHENRAVRRAPFHLVLGGLVVVLIALAAVPGLAAARPITVDNLGDEAGAALCAVGAPTGECTLRAAIEESNTDTEFDLIQFNGVPRSQLVPQTPLPTITAPVYISGEREDEPLFEAPSVGITAPTGSPALLVEANDVTIESLALGGGKAGIEVAGGSTGLIALGNWFGLKQDGEPNGSGTAGIILGQDSDGAQIGSTENGAARRNVFANSIDGIEIIGASKTKILGNYIGVKPDGAGPPTLTNGIVVEDGSTSKAEETEIGDALSTTAAATPACDGACNVIATDGGFGILITGETAGLGHRSRIRGNVLGLGADGITPEGESSNGVIVLSSAGCGGGPEVTVGGATPTETNYIVGAQTGIYAEGVENFTAVGNAIGIGADGKPSALPEAAGIAVCAEGVTGTAHVTENHMVLGSGAIGIESSWGHAEITGNSIVGGEAGILTNEEDKGAGDLIQGNTITDVQRQGIELANDSNVVIGNTITRANWSGIALEGHTTGNRIGGDLPGEANTIVESGLRGEAEEGDGAISMFTRRGLRNEFGANTGYGNFGAFIKLGPNPIEGEIPNGIAAPALGVVEQSGALGTTAPEAIVRIYAKVSAEPGELGAQLAKVKADAAGNWLATFAKQPVGGLVAATATKDGGTSEVSAPVAAIADREESCGLCGGGGSPIEGGGSTGSSNPPAPAQVTPPPLVKPTVKITAGPKKSSTATTAKFKFKVTNTSGAKFECKLDGAKWAKCTSPKTYKKLKVGKHTFRVRATANGLTGAVAKYQFTIKA